jgi:hypothetical protein
MCQARVGVAGYGDVLSFSPRQITKGRHVSDWQKSCSTLMGKASLCVQVGLMLSVAIGGFSGLAMAQERPSRLEIGVFATTIRMTGFDPVEELLRREGGLAKSDEQPPWWDPGGGVRVVLFITSQIAIEAQAAVYPRFASYQGPRHFGGGKGLFQSGVDYRVFTKRSLSTFLKAQVGRLGLARAPVIFGRAANASSTLYGESGQDVTVSSLLIGGFAEIPVTSRVVLRGDAGDQVIWFSENPQEINPKFHRHNLQLDFGIEIRLGKKM